MGLDSKKEYDASEKQKQDQDGMRTIIPERDRKRTFSDASTSTLVSDSVKRTSSQQCYAFVDELTMTIIQVVNQNNMNENLRKVYYQQKKLSKSGRKLMMYETDRDEEGNRRLLRRLEEEEKIPPWFRRNRQKERKDVIRERANVLLQREINKNAGASFSSGSNISTHETSKIQKERRQGLDFPRYKEPDVSALQSAYGALKEFLPLEDCEPFCSVLISDCYYKYYRPEKVKIILLAESHVYTPEKESKDGPRISFNELPVDMYDGPRNFVSLVYCLAYGEKNVLEKGGVPTGASKGTPQFWKLFAACSGIGCDEKGYGGTILRKYVKNDKDRIKNKIMILKKLKDRGIWLLDASIVGWYIQQTIEYGVSERSKLVYKQPQARPPPNMKEETLVLSWELYVKHVVQKAAKEGHLKMLIPIGKEVIRFITRKRLEDAVNIVGQESAIVHDGVPAPNAWVDGRGNAENNFVSLEQLVDSIIEQQTPS